MESLYRKPSNDEPASVFLEQIKAEKEELENLEKDTASIIQMISKIFFEVTGIGQYCFKRWSLICTKISNFAYESASAYIVVC